MQQSLLDQIADGAGKRHAASKIVRVLEQLAGERREGKEHRVFAQDHGQDDTLHFVVRHNRESWGAAQATPPRPAAAPTH